MITRTLQAIALLSVWNVGVGAEVPTIENARWLTASGNLEVAIARCDQYLCGTVVQVLANHSMSNPSAEMTAQDTRSAQGLKILTDLSAVADGEWKGHIYNRENGKTYDCYLKQITRDEIKIRAYVLLPLFGKTQIWKRVSNVAAS